MKKYKGEQKKNHVVAIVIVCVLCFAMGVSVPVIIDKATTSDEWEKLETVYSILTKKWYYADEVEDLDTELIEQAITGMADLEEDEHTNYFNLEQAQQFSSSLEGSNVGIGFTYYVDGDSNFVVKKTFINSPADKAGLQKGDIITQVGDMVCADNSSDDVVTMIKSNEDKELSVTYIRDGDEKTTTITPTEFDSTVSCEIESDYALIQLTSFSEQSASDFNEACQRIKKAGVTKLVLDLRNDGGGYLTSVLDIASCLLPENSTVFNENQKSGTTVQKTSNKYEQVEFASIVVLQNDQTASAAEVLIGALKDNLGSIVQTVGVTSYGKGTEQVSNPFSDGTSMKYTIAEWTTPNGTSINKKGFDPDYEVENNEVSTVKYTNMEDDEVIEADSVHSNAKAVQIYLAFLGYETDRDDEYFSPTSSKALAQFQSDVGLEVTGNCDKTTWDTLKEKTLLKMNEEEDALDLQMQKAIEIISM